MITVLKGSPQYAIDSDGLMTITTTWMLLPENDTSGRPSLNWLEFQTQVESWAGKPGDAYKMPKLKEGTNEAYEFETSTAFIVDTVNWNCVDGRTHYEVTYTNVQNVTVMQMIGNVSAETNSSNETTKTIKYRIDVTPGDKSAIDALMLKSGTSVDWAGSNYLIESSSYEAQSDRRYEISITAKDMTVMRIGLPVTSVNGYGQETITAVWRYSKAALESLPEVGQDASAYIGDEVGYLISEVSTESVGVLGYNVTITAVKVETRHLHTTVRRNKSTGVEYTINYQSDADSTGEFFNSVGTDASVYGCTGASITDVSIEETSRGNYNATLTAKVGGSTDVSSESLAGQVEVSASSSSFVLEPRHCGWDVMVNGAQIYKINEPPKTLFTYPLVPSEYISSLPSNSDIKAEDMLAAVRSTKNTVGYDWVFRVYRASDNKELTESERSRVQSLDEVRNVIMQGFVYAQTTWVDEDSSGHKKTMRNLYFKEWDAKKEAPIMAKLSHITNYPKVNGLDKAFDRSQVGLRIPVMEYNVTHNYKGNSSKILKKPYSTYYAKAIDYIENSGYTSYRGSGINVSEIRDDDGDVWTSVTCVIHALKYGYWNPNYGEHDAFYVKHK